MEKFRWIAWNVKDSAFEDTDGIKYIINDDGKTFDDGTGKNFNQDGSITYSGKYVANKDTSAWVVGGYSVDTGTLVKINKGKVGNPIKKGDVVSIYGISVTDEGISYLSDAMNDEISGGSPIFYLQSDFDVATTKQVQDYNDAKIKANNAIVFVKELGFYIDNNQPQNAYQSNDGGKTFVKLNRGTQLPLNDGFVYNQDGSVNTSLSTQKNIVTPTIVPTVITPSIVPTKNNNYPMLIGAGALILLGIYFISKD